MFLMDNFLNPNSANLTEPVHMLRYMNDVTGSWFGSLIILAVFIVLMVILIPKSDRFIQPFAVSSFVTALLAILFRTMSLINDTWLIFAIVAAIAGLAGLIFQDKIFTQGV